MIQLALWGAFLHAKGVHVKKQIQFQGCPQGGVPLYLIAGILEGIYIGRLLKNQAFGGFYFWQLGKPYAIKHFMLGNIGIVFSKPAAHQNIYPTKIPAMYCSIYLKHDVHAV